MSDPTVDRIRRDLRGLAAPEPPPDLFEKILASRGSGIRVVLPRVRRDYTPWILAAFAAAAAAVLVINPRGPERPPAHAEIDYQDIAAALSFVPRAALAQQTGPPRTPRYDLVHGLDAARAHAGTWTYETCTTTDDVLTQCGSRLTIMVREAQRAEQPAWLMIQRLAFVRGWSSTKDTIYVPPDTTYFARQTLRPIYWAMTGERIRTVRRFTPDSLREAVDITGPHPRSWRASARLPGPADAPLVLRWARFDIALLLQVLPLARGWQGSVYSVGLIGRVPSASPFPPLDLRVVGSERIDVPAGRFDCWKVEMRISDQRAMTLWASKDRGWLVKTRQGEPDWRSETTLVSAIPPAP
jgi:hypothetical protein